MGKKCLFCLPALFLLSYQSRGIQANAAETEGKQMHPYLYFTEADIPKLRQAAATTHKAKFDDLKKWADKFISFDPLPTASLPTDIDIMQVYCECGMSYIFNMALIYQLTGDDVYLQAAKKWLLAFGDYPAGVNGNFCIGSYAVALGSGYDMLYNELTPDQRSHLSRHIAATLQRGMQGAATDWWAGIALTHDHWLPIAGLGAGAAAIYYEDESAPKWLKFFLDILKEDMKIVGDDGAWPEGTGDWIYAMTLTCVLFDVNRRVTGEDLFQAPMAKNAIAYRMYNWLPDNTYIYHHDSFPDGRYNVLGAASCHLTHKLAHEQKDGHAQWLADQEEIFDLSFLTQNKAVKSDWNLSKDSIIPALHCVGWNYLWYDATIAPTPPDDLPLCRLFPNQGLYIARTGWQKPDVVWAFTCAPVGGHSGRTAVLDGNTAILANYLHCHAIANSFDIYCNGNYLAVPPSYGQVGSNCHNTLTIEGADQQQHPRFEANLLKTDHQADYTYVVGDATACYPESIHLNRWYRHFAFLPPNIFVIGDEMRVSETSTANRATKWHLDYDLERATASVDAASQTITVKRGGGALNAKILYPSNLTYEHADLGWFAKQESAVVKNLFAASTEGQIVAVLTALPNEKDSVAISRLIKGENAVGAAVDSGATSRAAVFCINARDGVDSLTRKFDVPAQTAATCYLFSLQPKTGYDVAVSAKPAENGLTLYTVAVQKGQMQTTNAEGTLVVRLSGQGGQRPRLAVR
jgi:hypothetical protein